MLNGRKIIVVMPAYNAEKTLRRTFDEIPHDVVDGVLLVDDASRDSTAKLAASLGIPTFIHVRNYGYGRNQKTCYAQALRLGADVVVMLHPDYQYSPKLITAMAGLITSGEFDVVLGSRILGVGAIAGGMPRYKYYFNRLLTFAQNVLLRHKLSEYHTGYRAFSKRLLLDLPLNENSDDFVFDNQMLAQAIYFGYGVGEISCPTKYFEDASSINFRRSCVYGLGVLATSIAYRLNKWGLLRSRIFAADGRRLHDPSVPGDYYREAIATDAAALPADATAREVQEVGRGE